VSGCPRARLARGTVCKWRGCAAAPARVFSCTDHCALCDTCARTGLKRARPLLHSQSSQRGALCILWSPLGVRASVLVTQRACGRCLTTWPFEQPACLFRVPSDRSNAAQQAVAQRARSRYVISASRAQSSSARSCDRGALGHVCRAPWCAPCQGRRGHKRTAASFPDLLAWYMSVRHACVQALRSPALCVQAPVSKTGSDALYIALCTCTLHVVP
jgi:hypothetical protein